MIDTCDYFCPEPRQWQAISNSKLAKSSKSSVKVERKRSPLLFGGRVSVGATNTEQPKHVVFRERGKREKKKHCQDLRCLPKTLASARRSVPSSKMSSRSIDVTPPALSEPETESAPIGPQATPLTRVTSGGAAAILSVASGSRALQKCSSPWLPSRRFSLGAAGAHGERPPQAWALLLALSPLPLHLDRAGALSAFPGR